MVDQLTKMLALLASAVVVAGALTTAPPAAAQVDQLPPSTSAIMLDSVCRTAHHISNPKDVKEWSAIECGQSMNRVWETAMGISEITGIRFVCPTTPLATEQLELLFTSYVEKHARTDYAALAAAGSAGKVALAAFMAAYPCATPQRS